MLIFGTMYILDTNDRVDDVQCNEVNVTDGDRLNSVNISINHQNNKFEVICGLFSIFCYIFGSVVSFFFVFVK